MRAEDDHSLLETDMGIGVTRVWIHAPLEHRAWDVNRAGDDTVAPALVLRAKVDKGSSILRRGERLCGFEAWGDAALCLREQLRRCLA